MSLERERVELADYARIVMKRKWMVIVPTILVVASAMFALRYMTPIYVSSALMEIVDRDAVENAASEILGERVGRRNLPRDYDRQKLQQLNQQLSGQPFLEPVGLKLGLHEHPGVIGSAKRKQAQLPDLSFDEIVVRTYTRHLKRKVSVEKGGLELYRFVCEDTDPYVAYQLAKAVAEEYVNFTLASGTEVTDRTLDFTNVQLDKHREDLAEAESLLHAHQAKVTTGVIQQSNPINDDNFAETRRLVDESDLEITTIEHRITRGMERLPPRLGSASALEAQVMSSRLQRLVRDLRKAEKDQVELMIQGGDNISGADVSRIRQDIFNEMRNQVAEKFPEEPTQVQNQIGDVVFDRIVISSVESRRAEVQRLLNAYSRRVIQKPQQELEQKRLESAVLRLRKLVETMEQKVASSELKTEATQVSVQSRVKIIDYPEVPLEPDRPNKARILILALVAGPILGLGAVILAEYLDTSLRTVEEVEEVLGLPVLGTIPKLAPSNTSAPRRRRRRRGSSKDKERSVGAAGLVLFLSALAAAAMSSTARAEVAPVPHAPDLDSTAAAMAPPNATGEFHG